MWLYTVDQRSTIEIAQQLDVCHDTVCDRLEKRGIGRRNLSVAHTIYLRDDFSGDPLEKAYLQGFCYGDVTIAMCNEGPNCVTIQVSAGTTRPMQLQLYHELFSPYGHASSSQTPSGCCHFKCNLNMSFAFLLEQQDCIPAWILQDLQKGNESPLLSFTAGYTDAEGHFHVRADGKNSDFRLRSYDVGVLRQLQVLFNGRLGIFCPPVHLDAPQGTPIKGTLYSTNDDCWCLGVYRKASLYQLCELLDPYMKHADRRQDMYAVQANVRARGV